MDHDRAVFLSVLARVFEFETLRHLEIQLNGAALPRSADGIFQMEIDLRAVERAVALVDDKGKIHVFQRVGERLRGLVPVFFRTHTVRGTGGQFHMIFKADQRINFVDEFDYALDLVLDLGGQHENMHPA